MEPRDGAAGVGPLRQTVLAASRLCRDHLTTVAAGVVEVFGSAASLGPAREPVGSRGLFGLGGTLTSALAVVRVGLLTRTVGEGPESRLLFAPSRPVLRLRATPVQTHAFPATLFASGSEAGDARVRCCCRCCSVRGARYSSLSAGPACLGTSVIWCSPAESLLTVTVVPSSRRPSTDTNSRRQWRSRERHAARGPVARLTR